MPPPPPALRPAFLLCLALSGCGAHSGGQALTPPQQAIVVDQPMPNPSSGDVVETPNDYRFQRN